MSIEHERFERYVIDSLGVDIANLERSTGGRTVIDRAWLPSTAREGDVVAVDVTEEAGDHGPVRGGRGRDRRSTPGDARATGAVAARAGGRPRPVIGSGSARRVLLAALLALVAGLALALELHFVDVGQGDGVLIVAPDGRAVVYDAGPGDTAMLAYLRALGITDVVLVVASHAHADHIGGLPAVIDHYRPTFVLDNGLEHTTHTYERYLAALERSGVQVLSPTARTLSFGDVRVHVLPSPQVRAWGHNDNSVGLVIEYGAFRATLTGDAEDRLFAWWLADVPELLAPVQVHKASHHGSAAGDTPEALAHLQPEVVVASLGRDNGYGHPHEEAIGRYFDAAAMVYRTDWHGTVVIEAALDGGFRVSTALAAAPMTREPHAIGDAVGPGTDVDAAVDTCVDLNRASVEELQDIVHVGPERAEAIVDLRPLRDVDGLRGVDGLGEARLRDINEQGVACVP